MNKSTKEKIMEAHGITLIALVITIVVLLLLAGVTINTLIGDNGILNKVKIASDKYSEEEIKECIRLSYLELQGERLYNKNIDEMQFLKMSLEKVFGNESVIIEKEEDIFEITIKIKNKDKNYTIDDKGIVSIGFEKWKQNEDGSFSKGETKGVQVGDIVKYEEILPDVTLTPDLQIVQDILQFSGFNYIEIEQEKNLKWRVLDVEKGKIRLISRTNKRMLLSGEDGYNNGVYLLNEICNVLYSSNKGTACNLNIEDFQKFMSYDYRQNIHEYSSYDKYNRPYKVLVKYGDTGLGNRYGRNYPKLYEQELGCVSIDDVEKTGTLERSVQTRNQLVNGKNTANVNLVLTQTAYEKQLEKEDFINDKYYNLLDVNNNRESYWIASRCVNLDLVAGFGFYIIGRDNSNNHKIFYRKLYEQNDASNNYGAGACPVITINSDAELEKDGENTWKIK